MKSTINFHVLRSRQLPLWVCLLVLGFVSQPLAAQKLTLGKGKLCLDKGKTQDCVALPNTVSVLYRDAKGLHLETMKSNLKPDVKALSNAPGIQRLPVTGLTFSLEKDVVRWQVSKGKVVEKGESPLGVNQRLVIHGTGDQNDIFVVPECLPVQILVRSDGFVVDGHEVGKGVYLGLSPGSEGNRAVLACSGVGVAVDILDNIDDPSFDYNRWANEHMDENSPDGNSFPDPSFLNRGNEVSPEALQAWRDGFCTEFEWEVNMLDAAGEELVYCTLNAKEDRLLLDCEGDLIVVKDGVWHRIPLDACPIGLLLSGPDEVRIIATDKECLSSLDCL